MSGVPSLEFDQQFQGRLIRVLVKALRHLFPVFLEVIWTVAAWLFAEESVRFLHEDDAACLSILPPEIYSPK